MRFSLTLIDANRNMTVEPRTQIDANRKKILPDLTKNVNAIGLASLSLVIILETHYLRSPGQTSKIRRHDNTNKI